MSRKHASNCRRHWVNFGGSWLCEGSGLSWLCLQSQPSSPGDLEQWYLLVHRWPICSMLVENSGLEDPYTFLRGERVKPSQASLKTNAVEPKIRVSIENNIHFVAFLKLSAQWVKWMPFECLLNVMLCAVSRESALVRTEVGWGVWREGYHFCYSGQGPEGPGQQLVAGWQHLWFSYSRGRRQLWSIAEGLMGTLEACTTWRGVLSSVLSQHQSRRKENWLMLVLWAHETFLGH